MAQPKISVPAHSKRLFPDQLPDLETSGGRALAIETLMENGDSEDLRAFLGFVPEEEWASWLQTYGGKRLSRRSRTFWSWILKKESSSPHPLSEEIWPL